MNKSKLDYYEKLFEFTDTSELDVDDIVDYTKIKNSLKMENTITDEESDGHDASSNSSSIYLIIYNLYIRFINKITCSFFNVS